jgi:hypothetical protein
VATALYQAAHDAAAPQIGVATFNVTVLRTGVVEVTLASSSDKKWQVVAERAARDLLRAPPRVPPPREGVRLTLRITAEETMPNGLKPSAMHGARLEAVAPRFRDLEAEQKELELKNPTAGVGPQNQETRGSPVIMELPGVFVTGQGKVCGYRVGLTPFGLSLNGGCDPSNIGAKLQRIVRTEVKEQTAF